MNKNNYLDRFFDEVFRIRYNKIKKIFNGKFPDLYSLGDNYEHFLRIVDKFVSMKYDDRSFQFLNDELSKVYSRYLLHVGEFGNYRRIKYYNNMVSKIIDKLYGIDIYRMYGSYYWLLERLFYRELDSNMIFKILNDLDQIYGNNYEYILRLYMNTYKKYYKGKYKKEYSVDYYDKKLVDSYYDYVLLYYDVKSYGYYDHNSNFVFTLYPFDFRYKDKINTFFDYSNYYNYDYILNRIIRYYRDLHKVVYIRPLHRITGMLYNIKDKKYYFVDYLVLNDISLSLYNYVGEYIGGVCSCIDNKKKGKTVMRLYIDFVEQVLLDLYNDINLKDKYGYKYDDFNPNEVFRILLNNYNDNLFSKYMNKIFEYYKYVVDKFYMCKHIAISYYSFLNDMSTLTYLFDKVDNILGNRVLTNYIYKITDKNKEIIDEIYNNMYYGSKYYYGIKDLYKKYNIYNNFELSQLDGLKLDNTKAYPLFIYMLYKDIETNDKYWGKYI